MISVMHKYVAKYFLRFLGVILNDTAYTLVLIYRESFTRLPHSQHDNCADKYYNNRCAVAKLQFLTGVRKNESRRLKMKNARNGHIHSLQAWYNRTTNLKFDCFYTPLGRGLAAPTTPQRKRERFSKNSDELFAEKDWRNATYGDN